MLYRPILGPFILKKIINRDMYEHFMLFYTAICILVNKDFVSENKLIIYANSLLVTFVERYNAVYTQGKIVYNIHSLCHLGKDVEKFGTLDEFSAFKYESYLGKMKNLLRNGNNPLQQLVTRIHEQSNIKGTTKNRTGLDVKIVGGSKIIPGKLRDSCVELVDGAVGILTKFVEEKAMFSKFLSRSDAFHYPCKSRFLNIKVVVKNEVKDVIIKTNTIKNKCFIMPKGDNYIIIPLLHTQI